MKTKSLIIALTALAMMAGVHRAAAQTTTFSYQGFLTAGGAPANGTYDLTFTLFDASSGGSAVGTSNVVDDLAVTNGLFTVPLNFGSAAFDGSDRWIEIAVRPGASSGGYTNLTPRQQITATPYAIRALTFSGTVAASQITGTVPLAQLPAALVTNGETGLTLAGAFTGNGGGLTNVPGVLTPQVVAGASVAALPNQAYLFTNAAPAGVILPVTATVGDVVQVNGFGAGGWQVQATPGVTWTARDSNRAWYAVASSADGTKLAAVAEGSQIRTSTDSGVTWTSRDTSRQWHAVASSADGSKLVAGTALSLYTSTDSGATWTLRDSSQSWKSVASSADGSKLVAIGGAQIYTSTNSGVTWTVRDSFRQWYSVASSSDGSKLVAGVGYGGQIYTSTDSGVTWTPRESGRDWRSVASSADGSKLAAVAFNGQIYVSTDSGVTWTPRESNRTWLSVASSADGSKLVAAVINGLIYTSSSLSVSGEQGTAQQFQYLGNGTWQPLGVADTALGANVSLLGQSIESSEITDGTIVDADIHPSAAIADTKLATIATAGKVANSATTATSANTANAIVARDASGNFSAGTVNGAFTGNGVGLTNLSAANLNSGTVPLGLLPGAVVTNGESGVSLNGTLGGNGAGLTNLNATNLFGTLADARLATNIARLDGTNVFTGTNRFAGVVLATNVNNQFSGSFTGNAADLTGFVAAQIPDLDASKITSGTFDTPQIPNLDAAKITTGTLAAAQIPNLDAAKITSGTLGAARIPNLDAAKLTSGTLADARLSTNVALRAGGNTFSSAQEVADSVISGPQALDQQQTNLFAGDPGAPNHWQSFTAGDSGLLTAVAVHAGSPQGALTSPGTIRIYAGEGTNGTLLATEAVTWLTSAQFQSFTLSPAPLVQASNKYTLQFSAPSGITPWGNYVSGDPYPGGRSSYSTNWDYAFKTWVTPAEVGATVLMVNPPGNSGYVGIGTNAPQARLHVVGDAIVTGALYGSPPYVKFSDQQPKGTGGGSSVNNGVQIRTFNTITNSFDLGSINNTTNLVLPAGTYQCRIAAPAFRVGNHQARLRIAGGGAVLLYGTPEFSTDGAGGDRTTSVITGQFTLAGPGDSSLVVEHYTQGDTGGNGLGSAANASWTDGSPVEVYTVAEFWKVK